MPFVGLLLPFVGYIVSHIRPFVCRNRPFILNRASSGFTLVELIVTVVIVGILTSIAAPAFVAFVKNNRLTSQANGLMADLAFARSEGIKRGTTATICKSTDITAAPPVCDTSGNPWSIGWVVWVDGIPPALPNGTLDVGEVLRVHEKLTGQNTLTGTGTLANQIQYLRSGLLGSGTAESFSVCDDRGPTRGRSIQISVTGRPRISDTPPASCT